MSRGVRGAAVFYDEEDYDFFLELLEEYRGKYGFEIHSYCIMPNHFHLLLQTGEVSVSVIMQKILKIYSTYFNAKYRYSGHVFQGRFVGLLVENRGYFLETSRYIHLNPVKAHMVKKPEDYKYSSYRTFLKSGHKWKNTETQDAENSWVSLDTVLGFFPNSDVKEYARFVGARIGHEEHELNIMAALRESNEEEILQRNPKFRKTKRKNKR